MSTDYLRVAIYARVSSEQQAKQDTIASQLEALTKRIQNDALACDPELSFVDDGYSGGTLVRPGLERLRDQAAAGTIDRLYVLDPDRFSRKYAYQVLILEELNHCGVEVIFLCNPLSHDPSENLLLQVQGMIAEYERAKILERSRRGKQHAAHRGSVNVLSGAPYGYRYVGKHEADGEARYQVVADEARVVQRIFEWVGQHRCSLGEVCRRLKDQGVPTRTGKTVWDRSAIWGMLKNPAYKGTAAFGKTRSGPLKPQRLRPQRGRPRHPRRPVSRVDTPAENQIFIDVPAIVDEALFTAVQAQLEENRQRKRTRAPRGRYLLQGLIVCKRCGYGCYGKPTSRASAKGLIPYAYYRCTGSDAYRFGGQRICWNKQVRTDLLDAAVWEDVRQLLCEPDRIRVEYERRQKQEPAGGREVDQVMKLINQVKKSIFRLIDAYEEGLLVKSEFEPRLHAARERQSRLEDERRRTAAEENRESELRLVIGQLEEFVQRVSDGLREPDWATRREIICALVKQIEVDEGEVRIVYRVGPSPFERSPQQGRSQHCWGREDSPLRRSLLGSRNRGPIVGVDRDHRGAKPHADQPQDRAVADPDFQARHQPVVRDRVEVRLQVRVVHLHPPGGQVLADRVDRLMGVPARTEPEGTVQEVGLKDRLDHQQDRRLDDPIADRGDSQRSHPAIRLGDLDPLDRLRPVAFGPQVLTQRPQERVHARAIDDVLAGDAIHAGGTLVLVDQLPGGRQHVGPVDPVIQSVEPELRLLLGFVTQLASQLREFRRQRDPLLHLPRHGRWVGGVRLSAVFRSGTMVQAVLLASKANVNPVGALGSTGITPFRRYYGPLRLPAEADGGYAFPTPVALSSCPELGALGRVSQVPRWISPRPLSPFTPESPTAACARCLTAGVRFRPFREVDHSHIKVSRGRTGFTCVTADEVAFSGFDGTVPHDAAELLHGERAIPMISTFQLTRSTRLTLAHRIEANSHGFRSQQIKADTRRNETNPIFANSSKKNGYDV